MLHYKVLELLNYVLVSETIGGGEACNIFIFLKNANILTLFLFRMETNCNVSQLNRNSVFQTASVSICP